MYAIRSYYDGNSYLARPGEPLTQPQSGEAGVGEFDDQGIPETIEGYNRLNAILAATDQNLTEIQFGEAGNTIQIRSPKEAAELLPLYAYDPERDIMINQETGVEYQNIRGTFSVITSYSIHYTKLYEGAVRQPLESLPAEFGEIAGVIEMAVGEEYPVYRFGRHRELLPVSQAVLLGALKHSRNNFV